MEISENGHFRLEPDESDYIRELISRNAYIIRAAVKSTLNEKFDQIGEDCISQTYLLACEKIVELKKHENPDGWIIVAAKMVAKNEIRKYKTQLNHTIDEEIKDIPVEDTVFEDALYNIWLKDGVIDKLLNTLTPHERTIYNYLYRKRFSLTKVAEIMNLSENTIKNTRTRIKSKIKNAIEQNNF